ncbi:MAG TPA: hypothetical protein VK658_16625 [Chryseolinea sp.]|nr:hypothetical protein [Chryseolinea sp.]
MKVKLAERNKRIVEDFYFLLKTTKLKQDVNALLAEQYQLSKISIIKIVRADRNSKQPDVRAERNRSLISDYNELKSKQPYRKKNHVLTELAFKYNLSVAGVYYVLDNEPK